MSALSKAVEKSVRMKIKKKPLDLETKRSLGTSERAVSVERKIGNQTTHHLEKSDRKWGY